MGKTFRKRTISPGCIALVDLLSRFHPSDVLVCKRLKQAGYSIARLYRSRFNRDPAMSLEEINGRMRSIYKRIQVFSKGGFSISSWRPWVGHETIGKRPHSGDQPGFRPNTVNTTNWDILEQNEKIVEKW